MTPVARHEFVRWHVPVPAPDCPPGWRTGPPDFVGVGAQRCGTTWWYRGAIESHPQVTPAAGGRKELYFFDRFFAEPVPDDLAERYHRLFPRPAGTIAGEWSPRYMTDFWSLPLLARIAPEARILIMLRDPVERYRSGIGRELRLADRHDTVTDIAVVGDAIWRSQYHRQVRRALELFGRDRVLILQLERCGADTLAEMRRTQEFLGLEPLAEVPERLRRERTGNPYNPELPGDLRAELVRLLAEDVDALCELCPELDRSLWPHFA